MTRRPTAAPSQSSPLFAPKAAWAAVVIAGMVAPRQLRAEQAPLPTSRSSCEGTLDGHVVDTHTHGPVAGATVLLNKAVVVLTDDGGRFALKRLCAGVIELEVERSDYVTSQRSVTIENASSVEIELTPLGQLVIVEERAPVELGMQSSTKVSGEALERTRGRSFSDALAEVPGVSQLRSASGLSKPIVRGMYGRRLIMLVDSVRHRSQDWGIDHVPEIDPFIADTITVVRGASGVRFGPDAIGGAVLVGTHPLLRRPGADGEAHIIGVLGRGGSLAGRVRTASETIPGLAWNLEGSTKRLAAAVTPDYALGNTGSLEWSAGGTAGYRHGPNDFALSYRHYAAKLGVCFCLRIESPEGFRDQLALDAPPDADLYRSDLSIDRPYQSVSHELATVRVRRDLGFVGKLTSTYAFQFDHRLEFDTVRDATGPQFSFRLATHDLDVSLAHNPVHLSDHLHLRGSVGTVAMAQDHNYSGLPLIPDYTAWGVGAFAIERLIGHDFEVEAGVRYDALSRSAAIERGDFLRLVRSDQIDMGACGDSNGDPVSCDSTFHTLSASVGGLIQLTDPWSVKLDLSTASRPPNPDEQYLNGTSPTFPVLGLGSPGLGAETTYSATLTSAYQGDHLALEASGYANRISDYIDFSPAIDADGNQIFDVLIRGTFPRFITRPLDAVFYGADAGLAYKPIPALELGGQLSMVRASNVTGDTFLTFVPPDRLRGSATYTHRFASRPDRAFLSVAGAYTARQNRFDIRADLAAPPAAYFLLDAEAGAQTELGGQLVKLAVQGQNLLNTRYRDYTSVLKYFADQPGLQIMIRLTVQFSSERNPK